VIERVIYYLLTCDQCGTLDDPPGATIDDVRRAAKAQGWISTYRRYERLDLCPECAKVKT